MNARLSITKCDSVVQRSGMNSVGLEKYLSSSPVESPVESPVLVSPPVTLSISLGGGKRGKNRS